MTKTEIEKSLVQQLMNQGKTDKFYLDLVSDYVYYYSLKRKLQADINKNGIRYWTTNGNGVKTEKQNESVVNLQKTTTIMLKILSDLNLKEPTAEPTGSTDGYM